MRVSGVLQVQFPLAGFVSVDTGAAVQSLTADSCDRYKYQKLRALTTRCLAVKK
jgi:hypothetical protein